MCTRINQCLRFMNPSLFAEFNKVNVSSGNGI